MSLECFCGLLALVSVQFYRNGQCLGPKACSHIAHHLYIVGFEWASTILAILATVMGAFPFMFYRYGPSIRKRSRYAQEIAKLEEEERQRAKAIELLDETKTQE